MATLIEVSPTSAADRLQQTMAAVRLSFTWLGVRRTLTPQQKERAADTFGASGKFLSAGKKLLDTSHPAYKAVTSVRSQAVQYWKSMSLPYPEPGLRLIRQSRIEVFDERLRELREDLHQAVAKVDAQYGELKRTAGATRVAPLLTGCCGRPVLVSAAFPEGAGRPGERCHHTSICRLRVLKPAVATCFGREHRRAQRLDVRPTRWGRPTQIADRNPTRRSMGSEQVHPHPKAIAQSRQIAVPGRSCPNHPCGSRATTWA